MTFKYTDVYAAEMDALVKAERDDEWVRAVLNDVFKVADSEASERARNSRIERVSSVMQLKRESPSVAPFEGTAYGAYNAVTEYADWFMPVLGKGDKGAKRALRTVTSPEVGQLKARTATALRSNLDRTATQILAAASA
jgi:hypothetical protein